MSPEDEGDVMRKEQVEAGEALAWKSEPCTFEHLEQRLNGLQRQGREVFSVVPISNSACVVISRPKPLPPPIVMTDELIMPMLTPGGIEVAKKKGRK